MVVEGEEDILIGDMLSCKVIVKFPKLEKDQTSGYVHSSSYPYLRRDKWYLIITDVSYEGLAQIEQIPANDRYFEKTYKEMIFRTGPVGFVAVLANDSYKGLDIVIKRSKYIMETSKKREEHRYKKIDKWLCEDTATFYKRRPEDFETDDEDEAVEAFVENEPEIAELTRRLEQSGLEKAHQHIKNNKF